MAANATRLLLLGSVRIFGPANGYQLRRELQSWQVEEWASLNPGSIYTGLANLAKQGHVQRYEVAEGARDVGVFTITDSGLAEFTRLLEACLTEVRPYDRMALHAALNLVATVPREQALTWLRARAANLETAMRDFADKLAELQRPRYPTHLAPTMTLVADSMQVERRWLDGFVTAVEGGAFAFDGEPLDWEIAADDPGLAMAEQNKRYRKLLGLPAGP